MPSVADLVEEESLGRLAGPDALAQGSVLAGQDHVHLEAFGPLRVTARVEDAGEGYRVELRSTGDGLAWSCGCPDGRGGAFCRHAVAAARVTWERAPKRRR
jgi:uncharacterized Zn finger protein